MRVFDISKRQQIQKVITNYIDPDDDDINMDEIEINENFVAIVLDSGVLAVNYTINEDGNVIGTINPTYKDIMSVQNLINQNILTSLTNLTVERMNGGKSKRKAKKTRRSLKKRGNRTRKA